MEKYQYCESKDVGTTYVETDCWYLLDLPVCKPNVAVIKKERENFFEKELKNLEAIKNFDISGLYLLINSDKKKSMSEKVQMLKHVLTITRIQKS